MRGLAQESVFRELKLAFCAVPALENLQFDKRFILDTDAIQYEFGAVLSSLENDKGEHPIFYYSRVLNPAEKNYFVTEKEYLAIVPAVE